MDKIYKLRLDQITQHITDHWIQRNILTHKIIFMPRLVIQARDRLENQVRRAFNEEAQKWLVLNTEIVWWTMNGGAFASAVPESAELRHVPKDSVIETAERIIDAGPAELNTALVCEMRGIAVPPLP